MDQSVDKSIRRRVETGARAHAEMLFIHSDMRI